MYAIIRAPVLMEDEGRSHIIKTVKTRAEAKKWIAAQEGEYFKPQDYYISYIPSSKENIE